jgi:uncharacterized protein (TIGR02246 family)
MKHFISFSILFFVSFSASSQAKAKQEILKLTTEYSEAIARRDASVHNRLFADDYTYTHGGGNIMGREEHMNFTKKGNVTVDSLTNKDMLVRIYGKTAVVTGAWDVILRDGDKKAVNRNLRYILVFVKRDGRWQIVAEQRTGKGNMN